MMPQRLRVPQIHAEDSTLPFHGREQPTLPLETLDSWNLQQSKFTLGIFNTPNLQKLRIKDTKSQELEGPDKSALPRRAHLAR